MRIALVGTLYALALSCGGTVRPPSTIDAGSAVDARPSDDVAAASAADVPRDAGAGDATTPRLRVLFVGNSYVFVNDLPAVLAAMSRAGGDGPVIEVDGVTVGGATLRDHWTANTAPARVAMGGWSAVVLQEQSVTPALNYSEFRTYGLRFGELATMHGARPVFYATWPRRAGDAVYSQPWSGGTFTAFAQILDRAYTQVAEAAMGSVAHVGNAWVASIGAMPAIELYASDGSHPTPAGTWLAACVIYRTLTGRAPSAVMDGAATGVAPAEARALRELAVMQGQ